MAGGAAFNSAIVWTFPSFHFTVALICPVLSLSTELHTAPQVCSRHQLTKQPFTPSPFTALPVSKWHRSECQAPERVPHLQPAGCACKLLVAEVLSYQSSSGPCLITNPRAILKEQVTCAAGPCELALAFDEGVSSLTPRILAAHP